MTPKKGTKKKIFDFIVPLLLCAVFVYSTYSFFFEFKKLENIGIIILNLILMIGSFGGVLSFYLFRKDGNKISIIKAFLISAISVSAVSVGLPFFINSVIFNNTQWLFSVTFSLQVIVIIALIVFLSYYISSSLKIVSVAKVLVSIVISELSLKSFTSLFMVILISINVFTGTAFGEKRENVTYTPYETQEKSKRQHHSYTPTENDIYVHIKSQNGDGSEENPFNTLEEAKQKAKEIRQNGVTDHINVWILPGDYFIAEPITFDDTDAQNISYIAFPGASPSFTGAKALDNWYEDTQNGVKVFTADIPEDLSFDAMVKDGKTLPKTRYPESGYLTIETEDHTNSIWTEETKKWEYNLGDTQFIGNSQYNPENIKNINNVTVKILHRWVTDFSYLNGYDCATNKYTLLFPTTMTVESGDRYYFENIFEELNSPGEWYLDTEKSKVYYVPYDGETAENTVIYACINSKLIDIASTQDIEFYGIEFHNTNFSYPETFDDLNFFHKEKIKAPQAEIDVGGAVEVKKANNINFINCNFINIGNTALKFNKLVKNCKVEKCLFENIGGTGVFINGYNTKNEPEITENIHIIDNKITYYGQNWISAIGVLQTNARNCIIKNNEISDGYYTAISVGWVWGYDYNVTCNNLIQDNLIYNIGQGWLSDMGGIYTLGTQKGTVLSGNVIHDVSADSGEGGYGGWGIYLDEGSSYIEVTNNLVYSCGSESFHQHYGKENTVENNIFALSKNGQIKASRLEEHNQLNFKNNIVLTDNTPAYNLTQKGKFKDSNNLYWDLSNGKYVFYSKTDDSGILSKMYDLSAEIEGYGIGSIYENPEFRDPQNGDFTIADGNTAIEKINFIKWDYTQAGTLTDFAA